MAATWRRMSWEARIIAVIFLGLLGWQASIVYDYLRFEFTRLSPEEFEQGAATQMTSLPEWYAYLRKSAGPIHSEKTFARWLARIDEFKRPVDWDAPSWQPIFFAGKTRSDARWVFAVTRTELKSWNLFFFTIHPTTSELLLGDGSSVVGYRKYKP